MTLNGVIIAFILCYFTEFDSFGGRLRHSGRRDSYSVYRIIWSSPFGQNWPTLQACWLSAMAELLVELWEECTDGRRQWIRSVRRPV